MSDEPTGGTAATIRGLIAEVCALDPATIRDEGQLLGYGLDSLRTMELIVSLEESFGMEISEGDPELLQVRTVKQLAELIDRRRPRVGS